MQEYPNFIRRLPSDLEAAELISSLAAVATAGGVERQAEAFLLLSRWARQLSQRQQHSLRAINITASQQQTLTAAVHAALTTLQVVAPVIDLSRGAAILLLGSAAGALSALDASNVTLEEVAETVGTSLLSGDSFSLPVHQVPVVIENVISGAAALLSALSYNSEAACWIFTALLDYLDTVTINGGNSYIEDIRILKSLATFYPAMRTATTAMLLTPSTGNLTPYQHHQQTQQQQQLSCLNSLYGVLRAVLLPRALSEVEGNGLELYRERKNQAMVAAAATLAAGGMLESLVRYHQQQQGSSPILIPLIEALAEILLHPSTSLVSINNNTITTTIINSSPRNSVDIQHLSTAIAVSQVYQACRLPRPTPATLQCCIEALLDTVLSIEPLLEVLKSSSINVSAAQMSAALAQQAQQDSWVQYAGPLQSTAVMQFSQIRLKPEEFEIVLKSIQRASRRTHEQYRQYILQDWSQERAHVDYRPVQKLLEKSFLASMELLTAAKMNLNMMNSNKNGGKTLPAAIVLSILADLQFFRVNSSPHYASLLKDALQSLPLDPSLSSSSFSLSTAALEVVHCLPLYKDLEMSARAHGNSSAWLVDALSASKVQLLFTALTPCCRSLPDDLALDIVAPLAFLYLLYPHPGTATAAHTVLWSLMGARAQLAEQLMPYYVTRCLEKLPLSSSPFSPSSISPPISGNGGVANGQLVPLPSELQTHLQNFAQGLSTALATASVGSSLGLLSVERILAKCSEMAAAGECWDTLCLALFKVSTQQLVTVDFIRVNDVSNQIQGFILGCPVGLKGKLAETVMAMVVVTEDCVRKPQLATWYQDLSATVVNTASL